MITHNCGDRGRISRDQMFMNMAENVSLRSTCGRNKVGAVIAKDGRVVSMGYNGAPSGFPNEHTCTGLSCNISIHAETNAIAFAARHGISTQGATLYCTLSPCINCAKEIAAAGITRVVFLEEYRDLSGLTFLREIVGVEAVRLYEDGEAMVRARWEELIRVLERANKANKEQMALELESSKK